MSENQNTSPDAENSTSSDAGARARKQPAPQPNPEKAANPGPIDPDSVVVPDTIAELDQTTWSPSDYAPLVTGSGAIKLHLSEVAPVVAAAQGYRTLDAASIGNGAAKDYLTEISTQRQLKQSVGNSDVMMIPWYSVEEVYRTNNIRSSTSASVEPQINSVQWRPSQPQPGPDGKVAKYVVAKGHPSVMGVHPATPRSWFGSSPIMICEGSLKASSALTGLLIDAGIDIADLSLTGTEKSMSPTAAAASARDRLRNMMESVPEKKRYLLVTLIGVGNWHQSPEWNTLNLTGDRPVLVAFDGDVSVNVNVWKQADALQNMIEKKKGSFHLVNVPKIPGQDKPGIDDYLATKNGTWHTLLATTSTSLPPRPNAGEIARVGDWRIDDATCSAQEFTTTTDAFGTTTDEWVTRVPLGGRIKAIEKARAATEDELNTGIFDANADANAEGRVEVEVTWLDENGHKKVATIEGDSNILADPPEMWHRRQGTHLPATVSSLPAWPADKKWLSAVKGHRREDMDLSSVWYSMGWVPVPGGLPVFIAGPDVVGPDGRSEDALPGITEKQLSGADRFGLNPPSVEDFHEEVREAIDRVLDAYTCGAWQRPGVAAIALATAMRPCVPIPPHAVLMLTGARRSGKAVAMSERITLANGTSTTIGKIAIGDYVLAADGSPTRVRSLSEVSTEQTYRVILADGSSGVFSDRHLFKLWTSPEAMTWINPWSGQIDYDPIQHASGEAVRAEDIASVFSLDLDVLTEWIESAGLPYEDLDLPLAHPVFGMTVKTQRVYPLGELLDLAARLASGEAGPGFKTVTTVEMISMLENGEDFWLERRGELVAVKAAQVGKEVPVRCLTVDHWSGTFLAGEDVPSHNSWTAEAIMCFWQRKKDSFTGSLPGTAGDTKYAIENAIAKTHIWVADDVAPSVDQRKAQATEGKIGSLIRDVHNRSATRRMSADGTAREQLMPRAMFIVTAENAQAASSEMDRVIHVMAGEKFLGTHEQTEKVRSLNRTSTTANKVATAAIMMIAQQARANGWPAIMKDWKEEQAIQNEAAASRMGNGSKVARHSGMAADMALGLSALYRLAEEVGCSDDVLDKIGAMYDEMYDYIRIGYEEQTSTSPGHAVIRALRSLMASGRAHVATSGQGGPPVPKSDQKYGAYSMQINQQLGWQFPADSKEAPKAMGPQIGVIAKNPKSDRWSIIFDMNTAFKEAQRAHPELILHGSRAQATWASAWEEGLCTPEDEGWVRKKSGAGMTREIVRAKGVEGVPVPLELVVLIPES